MVKKLKILLVSNGFYPEISARSFRATELATEFARQGHEVKVLTRYRDFDYSSFLSDVPVKLSMWRSNRFPAVPDYSVRPFNYLSRAITRLLALLFEYPAIENMFKVRKILKREKGYNLMISFAVPHPVHWGVAWARTSGHTIADTWIADCGDPYMGDILDSYRHPFYFSFLEKWFCRKADFITIPIEGARQAYYDEFHQKIRVIPQGFSFPLEKSGINEPLNAVPTFAYAGELIPGVRDPGQLMLFLSSVTTPFRFRVFTRRRDLIEQYQAQLGEKLIISDYIPRGELLKILSGMDFLINFDNNSDRNSPSKLIDYSIAGRPVLNIEKKFEADKALAFLKGDYSGKMNLPDVSTYHIGNVSRQFLNLSPGE